MPTTSPQLITLNVVDASPRAREIWSARAEAIEELRVEQHTEAPCSADVMATGLWALVPASFPADVAEQLVAMASDIPDSSQVMLLMGRDSGYAVVENGGLMVVGSDESAHAIK